jgi:hypothetical protein
VRAAAADRPHGEAQLLALNLVALALAALVGTLFGLVWLAFYAGVARDFMNLWRAPPHAPTELEKLARELEDSRMKDRSKAGVDP